MGKTGYGSSNDLGMWVVQAGKRQRVAGIGSVFDTPTALTPEQLRHDLQAQPTSAPTAAPEQIAGQLQRLRRSAHLQLRNGFRAVFRRPVSHCDASQMLQ